MNNDNITLLDIIDRRTLQSLQDAFADATGMAALTTDDTGSVTELSNGTDFCMNFTRKSRVGCERCNKCDLKGGEESSKTGRPAVYYCHGGLVDFAAPIILNGKHIGSLIGGQVLPEPPDEEKFRKIAKEIGVDPDKYIEALRKIKIVPKQQIDAAANLLYQMANALSQVGYQRLLAVQKTGESEVAIDGINEKFDAVQNQIDVVCEDMTTVNRAFEDIEKATDSSVRAVESTDSIIKAIESASTQLTLIGFNASIEAKRAGAAGAGFNVIAQEVRNLADRNTKLAGEV
ncbi:MAG: PocR ligand-binding domain-containing protein, partial [Oscillospiraceae bacterium]|nr:PocR ligand-binding domain-containing protein [Oscillospiraceae bacterium]